MTHLDLFTGIGGFHLAAGWAGFQTAGFSEIEPYCCQLLAEKWPEIPNYGDIRTADFSGLRGRITVCSAGVPCQPASLAGKRRGAGDDRWLWPAVLDVVGTVEPAWVILENPPGVASLDSFEEVLLRLATLGYTRKRYDVSVEAIGGDHLRYRTFIVGNLDCAGLAKRQSKQGNNGAERPTVIGTSRPEFNAELLREVHGIRDRSHRLKALGNAVVPQQVYPFFAAIAQVEGLRSSERPEWSAR
jgi:DNA (cytosine-5)-methyltransferase 1